MYKHVHAVLHSAIVTVIITDCSLNLILTHHTDSRSKDLKKKVV